MADWNWRHSRLGVRQRQPIWIQRRNAWSSHVGKRGWLRLIDTVIYNLQSKNIHFLLILLNRRHLFEYLEVELIVWIDPIIIFSDAAPAILEAIRWAASILSPALHLRHWRIQSCWPEITCQSTPSSAHSWLEWEKNTRSAHSQEQTQYWEKTIIKKIERRTKERNENEGKRQNHQLRPQQN